jgi:ectoine hydroxylase-related dioxygenase (phytanoyl-CoA dioxygenase family)
MGDRASIKGQFDEQGYYVARGLFPQAAMTALADAFMAQAKAGRREGLNTDARIADPADPLYTFGRMMHPHNHPELEIGRLSLTYMLFPSVGELLELLFGGPAVAAQSMFYFKPPGARGQDFHQDNFYLRVAPGTCIAAWTAVDDADQENGGLLVVPGSHRFGIICPEKADPARFFTTEHLDIPAGYEAVPVDLKAGDVLFFNGSVIHGSYPNASRDRFRRAFICHYAPQASSEIARFYKPLYAFDGRTHDGTTWVTGGGPCGTAQDAVKGPH